MYSPHAIFNSAMLGFCFLFMLILFISSILKKNKTMMSAPFITLCGFVTCLELVTCLEWLWQPGVYPRALFIALFILEYLLTYFAAAVYFWYARSFIYALKHPEVSARPDDEKRMVLVIITVGIAALITYICSINKEWLYSLADYSAGSLTSLYPFAYILSCFWSFAAIIELLKNHHLLSISRLTLMLSYVMIPTICYIVDALLGLSLGCAVSALVFTLLYTRIDNAQGERLLEHKLQLASKDAEMAETKMELMLSQIQPHFLYNALSSIAYLCTEDPVEAERATNEFSSYLKGNMRFINTKQPIPFEIELNHVEQYLNIEKRRFADRLNVIYDIQVTDFFIPALTLQTLVENAVRYSVNSRYEATNVKIISQCTNQEYIVQIIDDGPGFDPTVKLSDDRRHIGLNGARYRLKEMVNGFLEINSVIGHGTTVTIHIPIVK